MNHEGKPYTLEVFRQHYGGWGWRTIQENGFCYDWGGG
jgi:hypothetical protein